ncbi:hypothetical protein ISN45_Aa01g020860 [Arabidopsis thaliana x Arabidopsis arenosa]|uniref:Uncharacterized protein n=1 Tax=Arabidopsis thaliana x Arabidopsis arenosa TaxID=1240361 RepID=A0A8T2C0W4_9BRAS|nr:hypothetical protein ISN45_Aa01g020860 [Arabidopsis thaliana x Arabidopsis arenosa]
MGQHKNPTKISILKPNMHWSKINKPSSIKEIVHISSYTADDTPPTPLHHILPLSLTAQSYITSMHKNLPLIELIKVCEYVLLFFSGIGSFLQIHTADNLIWLEHYSHKILIPILTRESDPSPKLTTEICSLKIIDMTSNLLHRN